MLSLQLLEAHIETGQKTEVGTEPTTKEYSDLLKEWRGSLISPALKAEHVAEKILAKRIYSVKPLPTGVDWFDNFAGPLRRGNTYLLAGYPGVGKTTLALNLAWRMAADGGRVWYYCLELESQEVFEVLGCHILKKSALTPDDEILAYSIIQSSGFHFYESEGYKPWEARLEEIHDVTRSERLDCVFIDNLGFLTRSLKNSYEVEGVVSSRLKGLSQELGIPIVVLHHLRKPDSDQDEPEPTVHAMKGSGALLADCSDAFILHHPPAPNGLQSRYDVGYLLSGKPRWGRGGRIYVRLDGSTRSYCPSSYMEYPRQKRRKAFDG